MKIFLPILLVFTFFCISSHADDSGVFTYSDEKTEDETSGEGDGGVFMVKADVPFTAVGSNDGVEGASPAPVGETIPAENTEETEKPVIQGTLPENGYSDAGTPGAADITDGMGSTRVVPPEENQGEVIAQDDGTVPAETSGTYTDTPDVPEAASAAQAQDEGVTSTPEKKQTSSRGLGDDYASEDVSVSNMSREKPDFEVSGMSTTAGYLSSGGSDFPPVGKYYKADDVTVGKKGPKIPVTKEYTTSFADSQTGEKQTGEKQEGEKQAGEKQTGEKQLSDEQKRKKDPTVKVDSEVVDSNIKDPNKYQVKPQIYSEKDEKIKLVFDDVAYTNPDSKEKETKVIKSQYERGYRPDVVKTLGTQRLGEPYSAPNYVTEEAAKKGGTERTLGVPYSIRTKKQKEAIDRGY